MDTDMTLTMNADVSFAKAESDKYWAARSHLLGIIAYGTTQSEAEARLSLAAENIVSVLLRSGGIPVLREWLDKHHVEHSISTPGPREHKNIKLEVPINA
jgi:predicted RNase H-like HicB family nuclease